MDTIQFMNRYLEPCESAMVNRRTERSTSSFITVCTAIFLVVTTVMGSKAIADEPNTSDYLIYNKDGSVARRQVIESKHRRTWFDYNKDGSVKSREVWEINETGGTSKRTLYKGDGTLDHTYEDYYSNRNYLSRTNCYNAKGELDAVLIYFDDEDIVTILDGHGKFLRTESAFDPTIPAPSFVGPTPDEFINAKLPVKRAMQKFTDIHLDDEHK